MSNEVDLTIIEKLNTVIGANPENDFEDICDAISHLSQEACHGGMCIKCPLYHNRIDLTEVQKKLDVVNLIHSGDSHET